MKSNIDNTEEFDKRITPNKSKDIKEVNYKFKQLKIQCNIGNQGSVRKKTLLSQSPENIIPSLDHRKLCLNYDTVDLWKLKCHSERAYKIKKD